MIKRRVANMYSVYEESSFVLTTGCWSKSLSSYNNETSQPNGLHPAADILSCMELHIHKGRSAHVLISDISYI